MQHDVRESDRHPDRRHVASVRAWIHSEELQQDVQQRLQLPEDYARKNDEHLTPSTVDASQPRILSVNMGEHVPRALAHTICSVPALGPNRIPVGVKSLVEDTDGWGRGTVLYFIKAIDAAAAQFLFFF